MVEARSPLQVPEALNLVLESLSDGEQAASKDNQDQQSEVKNESQVAEVPLEGRPRTFQAAYGADAS